MSKGCLRAGVNKLSFLSDLVEEKDEAAVVEPLAVCDLTKEFQRLLHGSFLLALERPDQAQGPIR